METTLWVAAGMLLLTFVVSFLLPKHVREEDLQH